MGQAGEPGGTDAGMRLFLTTLENSADLVGVLNADGTLRYDLPRRVLGYEKTAGRFALDLVHPEERGDAAPRLAETLATEGPTPPFECRLLHADGTFRWFEMVAVNMLGDPEVAGILFNGHDVTERKLAEKRLEAEERRWRRVLLSTVEQTAIISAAGEVVLTTGNSAWLGYGPDERWSVDRALELVHPDDVEAAVNIYAGVLAAPGPHPPVEIRIKHSDGSWRWVEVRSCNMLDEPDVGGLLVTTRDVTERRLAEEQLQREERRWRKVLSSSTEQVALIMPDGEIPLTTGTGQLLGYQDNGPENIELAFDLVHPDDLDRMIETHAEMMSKPGLHGPIELRIRHYDGPWQWVESVGNNLTDDPDVGGLLIVTRSIHERKEAELQLQEQTRILQILEEVGRTLAAELDLETLLQRVTDAGTDLTDAAFGAFFYNGVGAEGETYLLYALSGAPREAFEHFPMPRNTHLFGVTFGGGAPVRCGDVQEDPRYGQNPPFHGMPAGHLEVRSYLAVPVVSRSGEVLGGLFFGHPEPNVFTERGEQLAAGVAAHAAIAIDNARLYQAAQHEIAARRRAEADLAHQATHDPLTGLPNRVLLLDRLDLALARRERGGGAVGVLLLDLDRFKVVNDSLGHAAGDAILVGVASRLLGAVRPGDTVARLGGDEFVVVCEEIHGEIEAVAVADRLLAALSERFSVGDFELFLTGSVGVALAPTADVDASSLLRDADAVMYRAKERGRNRWEVFNDSLRDRVVERLAVETALRRALERDDELVLHYQPVISLADGNVTGTEALIRWHHPTRGLVLPGDFIGVAEESGLVVPLGRKVVAEACRQLAAWAGRPGCEELTIAVNLSARQLTSPHFVRTVAGALADAGADPSRMWFEITETALMEDLDRALPVLRGLRELGVQLWIDDFGTGYSSLEYLRRLPLDGLKVDRSFIADVATNTGDSAIVAGIVNLAHSLGLEALAEGVESSAQGAELTRMGYELAQGWHWSPACVAGDLERWLDEQFDRQTPTA